MGIGSVLVGLGMLFLSLAVIIRPWRIDGDNDGSPQRGGSWQHQEPRTAPAAADLPEDLAARRDAVYGALTDLDFDRSVGKLNDDDYGVVRSQLMAQAVEVLQELDASSARSASIESQVEELVRARRASGSPRASRAGAGAALLGAMNVYCAGCGSALKPDDHFCGKCGTPVTARCPHCDAAVGTGDGFCVRCGAALLAAEAA